MRNTLFLLFTLLCIGCKMVEPFPYTRPKPKSSEQVMNERHDQYIGKTEDELIEQLGAPERTDKMGSYLIYYYLTDRGVSSQTGGGMTYGAVYASGKSKQHYQQSRFYIKDGKVVKWDYHRQ